MQQDVLQARSMLATSLKGNFKDPQAIKKLASQSDVITMEIEHVNTETLEDQSRRTHTATRYIDLL